MHGHFGGRSLLHVNRSGRTRLAAILFTGGLIALMTALAVTAGGVRSPGVTMYFVIVLMAGLLLGDINGNRAVTLSDMLSINAVLTQNVTPANYRNDVNASGTLTISDMLVINNQLTRTLPAP